MRVSAAGPHFFPLFAKNIGLKSGSNDNAERQENDRLVRPFSFLWWLHLLILPVRLPLLCIGRFVLGQRRIPTGGKR